MLGGSLAAVYGGLLATPLTAAFYKDNGTAGHRFGLITGIPMLMLSMHFIAALISHRLVHRKPTFIVVSIVQRLLFLPIAFLPMVFPDLSPESMIIIIGIILGVNAGATNFRLTLINSWLADLIPHRILNRFWGHRQAWMSIMIVSCYLAVAAFTHYVDWSITAKFQILVVVATIAGLIDVLLHLRLHEPAHEVVRDEHPFRLLTEPLRCKTYRSFLLFQCAWFASAVIAGSFMVVYTLEVLKVGPAVTTLIWMLQIVGPILFSRWWGRLADRHGHRPLLAICHTAQAHDRADVLPGHPGDGLVGLAACDPLGRHAQRRPRRRHQRLQHEDGPEAQPRHVPGRIGWAGRHCRRHHGPGRRRRAEVARRLVGRLRRANVDQLSCAVRYERHPADPVQYLGPLNSRTRQLAADPCIA